MAFEQGYPFADKRDFEDAERGFIAALSPGVVRNAAGAVVWDNDSYAFLAGDAPDTVNPSLWRQSTLNAKQGLFEVTGGHRGPSRDALPVP
jgi:alkyl sulfatase BDS1-like metallo-beta-lactamase superfamily hydrolase